MVHGTHMYMVILDINTDQLLKVRLTADIWIVKVQPVLLGLQEHLEVYSPRLRLMIDESSRDASREIRFITAKAQIQEQLLRVIIPQVEYVHHTANRSIAQS